MNFVLIIIVCAWVPISMLIIHGIFNFNYQTRGLLTLAFSVGRFYTLLFRYTKISTTFSTISPDLVDNTSS